MGQSCQAPEEGLEDVFLSVHWDPWPPILDHVPHPASVSLPSLAHLGSAWNSSCLVPDRAQSSPGTSPVTHSPSMKSVSSLADSERQRNEAVFSSSPRQGQDVTMVSFLTRKAFCRATPIVPGRVNRKLPLPPAPPWLLQAQWPWPPPA